MGTLSNLLKKVSALLLSLISFFAMLGPTTFSPVDANNLILNFSILADTHIDSIYNESRTPRLIKGLNDMAKAEVKSDALVIAGDITETGMVNQYIKLGATLKTFCKADNLLLQMGNHDIRGIKGPDGESLLPYPYSAGKFLKLMERTTGTAPDIAYYYRIIKGCYFIVLNPEWMEGMDSCLSETQIQWADNLLAEAVSAGNPVFIINHQPLEAVGEASARIGDVMQKYSGVLDIFYISGHYHNGFSANSITNNGTVYFVDTPAYGKTNSGAYGKIGTGFQVELYEDEIIFRARDFMDGLWVSEYDRTIELISGQ